MPDRHDAVGQPSILKALLLIVAIGPLLVALHTNINWDEFLFLSRVHEQRQGLLQQAFQTGYVHLFGWITLVGESEVDQILVARGLYYALLLVSAWCLYLVTRRLVSRRAALVACIAFFTFSNILIHGTSFRADGLLLFLYMACLAVVILNRPLSASSPIAGALFGASIFVTIKALLLAPTIVILLLMRKSDGLKRQFSRLASFSLAAFAVFGMAFAAHSMVLAGGDEVGTRLQQVGRDMLVLPGFLPQPSSLRQTLLLNPVTWALVTFGGMTALMDSVAGRDRSKHIQMLVLCLPLLSIFFYRNSFPYYYIVVTPAAFVSVGLAYERIVGHLPRWPMAAVLVPLLVVFEAIPTLRYGLRDTMTRQRVIIDAVHEIFPEPVPYIDGVSMIASYPKVGFFMSGWMLQRYRNTGEPIFRKLTLSQQPHFLLADASDLEIFDHTYRSEYATTSLLFDEDKDFLRNQFIHHWGPIYVPGTRFRLRAGEHVTWKTAIPGIYTVESAVNVNVDGDLRVPGSQLFLGYGSHRISTHDTRAEVALRWGRHLQIPDVAPPTTPIFLGF